VTRISNRALGELIAITSVVLSLIFVGLEFRQSTIASRAAAYQELGIATADLLFSLSDNSELNANLQIIGAGQAGSDDMTESERRDAFYWAMGSLRLYETVFLQVELGLLEAGSLDYLGWETYREQPWLREMWPGLRYSLTEPFALYIESSWEQN
jgi:hypothetical protein